MKILVAGFGNRLQRDDGFGVCLLKRLQADPRKWPDSIRFADVGIGGITLVHELLDGFDALIVLDAYEGDTPGKVTIREVSPNRRSDPAADANGNDFHHQDRFADIHYAEPGRAIALAHEVGVLPAKVFLLGCVPLTTEPGCELSNEVAEAVDVGILMFKQLVENMGDNLLNVESDRFETPTEFC